MNTEQIEDLKEILICLLDETQSLNEMCKSLNRKLENEKVEILKIQNQLSVTSCFIPEMEKTINRLDDFVKNCN